MTIEQELMEQELMEQELTERAGRAAYEAECVGTSFERFTIDSEDKANWLLRKLGNIRAEQQRVTAQTATILGGLESEAESLMARHEADLTAWAREQLEACGKGKTLNLHQGTVAFRTVPASYRVADKEAALVYGKMRGWPVVKTIESLDAKAYTEQAAATLAESGELIPGMEQSPARESMSLKFGPKGDAE